MMAREWRGYAVSKVIELQHDMRLFSYNGNIHKSFNGNIHQNIHQQINVRNAIIQERLFQLQNALLLAEFLCKRSNAPFGRIRKQLGHILVDGERERESW